MNKLKKLSEETGQFLKKENQVLVTAESCTGGGIATAITDISGSSAWFDRAFVTYSNDAKREMLGVNAKTLAMNGAVSEPVVSEMALGALNNSKGTIAVAVSGIAGPDGGTEEKPVGTVWFGWRYLDKEFQECCQFEGDRAEVRYQACVHALEGIEKIIKG